MVLLALGALWLGLLKPPEGEALPRSLSEDAWTPEDEEPSFVLAMLERPFSTAVQDEPIDEQYRFPLRPTPEEQDAWREERELRQVRRTASDLLLGVPMFVPQILLETFIPRGIAVGPTTFMYRTGPPDRGLSLAVFDQILFHESEFAARVQNGLDPELAASLNKSQRSVLRRSLMGGFRASYGLPRLSPEEVFGTAEGYGTMGYVAAPVVLGALVYLQGVDQRVRVKDVLSARFKLASGRDWTRAAGSDEGAPVFSVELKFCDFPVGLLLSYDVFTRGPSPSFIGVGTSLDVVEDLLGLNAITREPR